MEKNFNFLIFGQSVNSSKFVPELVHMQKNKIKLKIKN